LGFKGLDWNGGKWQIVQSFINTNDVELRAMTTIMMISLQWTRYVILFYFCKLNQLNLLIDF